MVVPFTCTGTTFRRNFSFEKKKKRNSCEIFIWVFACYTRYRRPTLLQQLKWYRYLRATFYYLRRVRERHSWLVGTPVIFIREMKTRHVFHFPLPPKTKFFSFKKPWKQPWTMCESILIWVSQGSYARDGKRFWYCLESYEALFWKHIILDFSCHF